MATIEERRNKAGEITSYRIIVSDGMSGNGAQIRRRKIWKPEPGMTPKQIEKALNAAAFEFEREVSFGYQLDNRQTFEQYAEYVLELKQRGGAKRSTIERYRGMLPRINAYIGHLKLVDIRPQHLNMLYSALSAEGERKDTERAQVTEYAQKLISGKYGKKSEIAQKAQITTASVSTFFSGKPVRLSTAKAIAKAMGGKSDKLFTVIDTKEPLAAKTILEHHRLISAILSQADKEMLVPYNAAAKATPPKVYKKEPNYFQPQDLQKILKALENEPLKWQVITHLMLITGCRRGEIMGLKWDKIDLKKKQLRIDKALLSGNGGAYEDTTKSENTRFLHIPDETVQLLQKYRIAQAETRILNADCWQDTQYLFTQDNGKPMNPDSATQWLNKFSARHNLPHINPHAFRHTVASVLIANGTDVVTVSKQLGHSKVTTTENFYSHIIEENKAKAAECIADVMLRGTEQKQA